MIVIKEKRNAGKTTKLVELLRKDAANLLLVFNEMERYRIVKEFNLGGHIRVLSWDYYLAHPEFWSRPLLIDNVSIFLQEKFKSPIVGVSVNAD